MDCVIVRDPKKREAPHPVRWKAQLLFGTGVTHPGKNDTKEILTNFITKMEDLTGKQTEFREELWGGLVDHIRIDEKGSTVVFRGGIEITI